MVVYNIVVAKNFEMGVYTCIHPNKASWKFWKNGGVYVYTCIHPNKTKIDVFELMYYGSI